MTTNSQQAHALAVSGLAKNYADRTVWRDLSFVIAPGSCVGLVGVNGAGKTTLFRCILDLLRCDAGRIDIFGLPHQLVSARSRIAYLPERFLPPAELRGHDFLRYTLALAQVAYDTVGAEQRAMELHLDPAMLNFPIRHFSKGTAQKLGLLASLLMNKDLYLLDEPMSGLDPIARRDVKLALRALQSRGAAILMSTHALHDVQTVCDRMLVLHDGEIRYDGEPDAFLARAKSADADEAFVAMLSASSKT